MEELQDKFKNLCDWIRHYGGFVNHKLIIQQTEKFGRTVVTTQGMLAGEELFKLPKELMLNPENCGLLKFNLSDHFEYRDQVVISLLSECQNPQTKWRPYIFLLPQLQEFSNHPLVLFYQNKFPSISVDIFNRVSNLYQSFNQFYVKLQHYNQNVNQIYTQMPNFNECLWAFLTVITRMWANAGMVPFADMLQHSNKSTIYLDTQGNNFSIMTCKNNIDQDSVIFDNYLVQDDITLYTNFGFVEESELSHLAINFQFDEKSPLISSIINSGMSKFQGRKIYLTTEGINSDLMAYLRLNSLDSNDLKISNFESENFYNQLISLANELRCLQKLKNRLNYLIDPKELESIRNNFNTYVPYSPEWSISKLVLSAQDIKEKTEKYIVNYWTSFIG